MFDTSSSASSVKSAAQSVFLFLFVVAIVGCGVKAQQPAAEAEQSLAVQLAAVREGVSDVIQLEHATLTDRDLAAIGELPNLRVLQLDDPRASFSAAGIAHLTRPAGLEHLRIRGQGIDDAALGEIANIQSLRILNVPQATITDDGLAALRKLPHIIQLRFGSPEVTDAGMKTLAGLPALLRLHLIDVPITDAGLKTLVGMDQLESLYLDGGDFSDAALEELFRQRPQLHVHLNQEHHDRDPHRHQH
jgi:hypothetical protein